MSALPAISYIVIARNESFALQRCLHTLCALCQPGDEILCVDSDSSDDTLEVMRRHARACGQIRIFTCRGKLNAAIARNVGLRQASRPLVCFVDGDTELDTHFIARAREALCDPTVAAVTGCLEEITYDERYTEVLRIAPRGTWVKAPTVITGCGGTLLARGDVARRVGLFDERLTINEDFDYAARISAHGRVLRLPCRLGVHHTRPYRARLWGYLRPSIAICPGLVLRKHWHDPLARRQRLKGIRGALVGLALHALAAMGAGLCLLKILSPGQYAAGLGVLIAGDVFYAACWRPNFLETLLYHFIHAPLIALGFFAEPWLRHHGTTHVEQVAMHADSGPAVMRVSAAERQPGTAAPFQAKPL